MPRSISSARYAGNRVPSPEEMLQIIQEQRRFIDNLKVENHKLQEQITELKNDRCVSNIMGFAQKNAEEIIRKAKLEADEILLSARLNAKKTLDEVDGYVQQIVDSEDSLEGMLKFLQRFRQHMVQIDDLRLQEGIAAALQAGPAAI